MNLLAQHLNIDPPPAIRAAFKGKFRKGAPLARGGMDGMAAWPGASQA
jgi:hypothetical protein